MKKFLLVALFFTTITPRLWSMELPKWCSDSQRYLEQVENYEREDIHQNNDKKIIFVGSSSIRLWDNFYSDFKGHKVLNRGIGGALVCDLLVYFDRIITKYNPPKIFIYVGENDVAANAAAHETFKRIVYLIEKIKAALPKSKIYFISLKPSPAREGYTLKMQEANELIKIYLEENSIVFIDIFSPMLNPDGTIKNNIWKPDFLHMNHRGYKIWLKEILPYL